MRDQASVTSALTVNTTSLVFGGETSVPLDDPAETSHEACKLYRSTVGREMLGRTLLERTPQLQLSATRSAKDFAELESVELPPPAPLRDELDAILRKRRSARSFEASPLPLETLSSLLSASYGVTHRVPGSPQTFRTVPSGGGLYPLDLYCTLRSISGVMDGIHYYDPLRHRLARLPIDDFAAPLARAVVQPELVEGANLVMLIAANFWRSRFKYGQRGYRFTLLEAGHVGQNLLLAAQACGLAACPTGGYYDAELDELLNLDGVHESVVYVVSVGSSP